MSTEQTNPYSPPEADIASAGAAPALATTDLASHASRFGSALVDGVLGTIASVPAFIGIASSGLPKTKPATGIEFRPAGLDVLAKAGSWGLVAGALILVLMVVNWYLLTKRGQTIGKIVAGTRVVLLDGSRAPFGRVVALRTWPIVLLQYVPLLSSVGSLLTLIDVLFIFRGDRRCLHDLVAGTKVVRAAASPQSP
jgi:uncharacterized RDD family membrane protein YckC